MTDWNLLIFLAVLSLFAAITVIYPLHISFRFKAVFGVVVMLLVSTAYWQWGAWPEVHQYVLSQKAQKRVQAMLKTVKNPKELIERLKIKVNQEPNQAKGWFLLGRLYASQGQWQEAKEAFVKAYQLKPQDKEIVLNYAQSLWVLNQNQFNHSIRHLFQNVLKQDSNQPDALAMLAMDAFMKDDYPLAIKYWQRLLTLAPPDSEDAKEIRKAIARAQIKLRGD